MVRFRNPNNPEQPAEGVYRWCYKGHNRAKVTIYVGKAGGGQGANIVRRPSTLARGISELQRGCISSDTGRTLDTDFIVGTAIQFFSLNGFDCYWEHCSDNPEEERRLCNKYKPLLQRERGTWIDRVYKLGREEGYWTAASLTDATEMLESLLSKNVFKVKT